ncbi:MAG: hypothetical protein M1825_000141 [Sarcosagium campestre]|nr:MAG: hypothetical protein M1825_000141 [Sarcosagium campestre]
MSTFKRTAAVGSAQRKDLVASLQAVRIDGSKPVLPAEIISSILEYLPIPDLVRFATVSKRMQEMVYDDSRWVQRLVRMGCWDEVEARKRFEASMRRRLAKQRPQVASLGKGTNGTAGPAADVKDTTSNPNSTLFDAGTEAKNQNHTGTPSKESESERASDGFAPLSLSAAEPVSAPSRETASTHEPARLLRIISTFQSVRGHARQEYGRLYGALAPFYIDLVRAKSHADPIIFRTFRTPGEQAKMLAQLRQFAKSDWALGWEAREEQMQSMLDVFEKALLRELGQSIVARDVDGQMKTYAHVLVILNGGQSGIDLFVKDHPAFQSRSNFGDPVDCLDHVAYGNVNLEASQEFFQRLSTAVNTQSDIIDRVFPPNVNALLPFLDRLCREVISDYVNALFDEAHQKSIPTYLKTMAGVFEQTLRFADSLRPCRGSKVGFRDDVHELIVTVFESHIDLYLQEELHYFTKNSTAEVSAWERKLSEQEASTESFFMANVNRQADKRDFLTSFKKVVMMPVNVLPTSFTASKPASTANTLDPTHGSSSQNSTRPGTPALLNGNPALPGRSVSPGPEAPTTELAAKAAIMNTKLEGIKSLFSLEIALNLVHAAKASIERAALFVKLGDQLGAEAKAQCESIFVHLLQILGSRHIRAGFNTAVDHLSKYNPREVSEHSQPGVAPLTTFLELVNVGDLIQQMVDVFFEQELIATRLTDRNDFLDPAVKEKKRFEQMLDERVAAGMNKGIDVLMDEVEYLCATTQQATDFNPEAAGTGAGGQGKPCTTDIGPSATAKQIVHVVSSHTKMLVGSTDKNMLDVFNQEVGLRLFTALCKHIKRQRISVEGSIILISDMNHYFNYIQTLKNADLLQYFKALRELSQVYLIDPAHAKEMATIIADGDRFYGIFRAEEVYEFAERRADWYQVRRNVERAMYGIGCGVM